jgi:hypothetical protein
MAENQCQVRWPSPVPRALQVYANLQEGGEWWENALTVFLCVAVIGSYIPQVRRRSLRCSPGVDGGAALPYDRRETF